MLNSLARAVGTAFGGWVFAWGMERGVVGLVWWTYLSVIAIVALGWSYTMRKDVGEEPVPKGRPDVQQSKETDNGESERRGRSRARS